MSDNTLIPRYLETDFTSLKQRLKDLMSQSDTFKDYDYEGANITMLMELVSYIGDLNTFFNNNIAKNIFPDTADIYEVVHSNATALGYEPIGWRSATVDLTITIKKYENEEATENPFFRGTGDEQLYIPAYYTINVGVNENGELITYTTTKDYYYDIPETTDETITFTIPLKQGNPVHINYIGSDLIDNRIILPFRRFDHGIYPYNEITPSVRVAVNDDYWTRVPEFYSDISDINSNDNVYMFKYDKYGRYILEFSSLRNVPKDTDEITIFLIETLGDDGNIGPREITQFPLNNSTLDKAFITIYWDPTSTDGVVKDITFPFIETTNNKSSYGSNLPDSLDELKQLSKLEIHSQKRNVNRFDYVHSLQMKNDIVKANVWGEQDIDPGNTELYNKVFISVMPKEFNSYNTINDNITIANEFTNYRTEYFEFPRYYNQSWVNDIRNFIEPRKYLCTIEEFVIPEIIFFKFDIGIRYKTLYQFQNVKQDILSRLELYFDAKNRNFHEIFDFIDLTNYLLDTTIKTDDNEFKNINALNELILRDVSVYKPPIIKHIVANQEELFELDYRNVELYDVVLQEDGLVKDKTVETQEQRFNLLPCEEDDIDCPDNTVRLGDIVYQLDTEEYFKVIDLENLSNSNGYRDFEPIEQLLYKIIDLANLDNLSGYKVYDGTEIYDYDNGQYPRWTMQAFPNYYENIFKPIELGFNQFPVLSPKFCLIEDEN